MVNALAGATLDHNSPVPLVHQPARLLKQLMDKGLLVRRTVAPTSLNDDSKKVPREPETRVLAFEEVPCSLHIAEHLGLESGAPVLSLDRLAYDAGERPMEYGWRRYPADSYWFATMLVERDLTIRGAGTMAKPARSAGDGEWGGHDGRHRHRDCPPRIDGLGA